MEAALGTPVQTAVKREDEQAFARLNGRNLMFCEDAPRADSSAPAPRCHRGPGSVRLAAAVTGSGA